MPEFLGPLFLPCNLSDKPKLIEMNSNFSRKSVFAAACIGMAFFGISVITLGSVLPSLSAKFVLDDLGSSSVVTFLPAGILLGSLIFGPVVDRFGYKYLLIFSSLAASAGLAWLACAGSLLPLRGAVFLTGVGGGILNGGTNALVSDISGENRKANLSLLGIFYGVGALGIPSVMGILSKKFTFETILLATALLMLLLLISFFFVKFPLPKQAQGFPATQGVKLLKEPVLLLLSLVLFFQSGLEGVSSNWTTTYLENAAQVPKEQALFALTCMVMGLTATRLILGFLLKKMSAPGVLAAALGVALGGMLLLMVPPFYYWGMTLLGVGLAATFPVVLGYIGTVYANLSGTAFGIALFIALIGNTVLNFLMGLVSEKFGIGAFPAVLIISLLALSGILVVAIRKTSLITKI